MTNLVPTLVASQGGPYAQMRTGTVVSFTTNQVRVSAGGSTFSAAYLKGTVLAAGNLVACLSQGGSWLVLGVLAGVGDNLLAAGNPSFEDSAPGTFPALWFQANLSGVSTITVVSDTSAPTGSQVAAVGGSVVGPPSYLYAQPIAVSSGEQVTLSAFAGGAS